MLEPSLQQLNLDAIIEGCQSESNQPRAQEKGYCFELFRRAFEEQEQAAWTAIDSQYKRLILHWICDCSPGLPREEIEEIVPEALPKFWTTLTRSAVPLTERFAHVGAVLKYLKQCAISVLRDHERRARRLERVRSNLKSHNHVFHRVESEQELLARIDQEKLLELVRNWVKTFVTDPQEQRVLSLSFEDGLTPSEIAENYPQEFPDVQTVRRVKERLLKRARRALGDMHSVNGNGVTMKQDELALRGVSVNEFYEQKKVANG